MMTGYTQVMRFSRQTEDGVEGFCAQWVTAGDGGPRQRRYFPHVSHFRSWLIDAQGYGLDEAEALIDQLRRSPAPAGSLVPPTTEWHGLAAD